MSAVAFSNFVDGEDIRMVQCRERLGFAIESGQSLGILGGNMGKLLGSPERIGRGRRPSGRRARASRT